MPNTKKNSTTKATRRSSTAAKTRKTSRSSRGSRSGGKGIADSTEARQIKRLLGARVFTVVLVFGIIVFGVSLTQSVIRKVEVQQQIDELEQEIAILEQQNGELDELMSYLGSSQFQDKEARKKLGLQESGEQVVVIQQEDSVITTVVSPPEPEAAPERTNPQKWRAYFFN